MNKKYYSVVVENNEQNNPYQKIKDCSKIEEADRIAKENNAKLYEFNDNPRQPNEDPKIRGKLIKDYSK